MNTLQLFIHALVIQLISSQNLFPLSIIHLNDLHARFEETNLMANTCKNVSQCIGGYARVVTMVKQLKESQPNPIYFNVGDNFQGTMWYSHFRWNATQYFLNLEPADFMAIGNHEFDHGVEGLVPFLDRINTTLLSCNINATDEPKIKDKFQKSIVTRKYGREMGIIGVTTTLSSDWGRAKVMDEVESVKKEVDEMVKNGIKIIIVLSHSGLEVDRLIAKNCGPIDIIIGGHSHSFLFTGEPIGPDTVVGDYPTIETQANGRKVLIVQASAYAKYLGNITLFFNDDGEIESYEGSPIFLSNDIKPDPFILEKLAPWKAELDLLQGKDIGLIRHELDAFCYERECGMGNLVTDSMAYAFLHTANDGEWTGAAIAMQGPGGMRAGLSPGKVLYADLVTTTPFENNLVSIELSGEAILEILEFAVSKEKLKIMQVSGIQVTYDLKREPYNRIVECKVLCNKCDVPRYENVDKSKIYRVAVADYIANGGDGYDMFPKYGKNTIHGPKDIDALKEYVEKMSPINLPPLINRIKFI